MIPTFNQCEDSETTRTSKEWCRKGLLKHGNVSSRDPQFLIILLMVQKSDSPVHMVNIPLFIGFYTSQVVQDLFHQHYSIGWAMPKPFHCRQLFIFMKGTLVTFIIYRCSVLAGSNLQVFVCQRCFLSYLWKISHWNAGHYVQILACWEWWIEPLYDEAVSSTTIWWDTDRKFMFIAFHPMFFLQQVIYVIAWIVSPWLVPWFILLMAEILHQLIGN